MRLRVTTNPSGALLVVTSIDKGKGATTFSRKSPEDIYFVPHPLGTFLTATKEGYEKAVIKVDDYTESIHLVLNKINIFNKSPEKNFTDGPKMAVGKRGPDFTSIPGLAEVIKDPLLKDIQFHNVRAGENFVLNFPLANNTLSKTNKKSPSFFEPPTQADHNSQQTTYEYQNKFQDVQSQKLQKLKLLSRKKPLRKDNEKNGLLQKEFDLWLNDYYSDDNLPQGLFWEKEPSYQISLSEEEKHDLPNSSASIPVSKLDPFQVLGKLSQNSQEEDSPPRQVVPLIQEKRDSINLLTPLSKSQMLYTLVGKTSLSRASNGIYHLPNTDTMQATYRKGNLLIASVQEKHPVFKPDAARIAYTGNHIPKYNQSVEKRSGFFEETAPAPKKIRIVKKKYANREKGSVVHAGALKFDLEPEFYAESKAGILEVETSPSPGYVFLDNRFLGKSPESFEDISPGLHVVRIVKKGYEEWKKEVMFRPEIVERIDIQLEKSFYGISAPKKIVKRVVAPKKRAGKVVVQKKRVASIAVLENNLERIVVDSNPSGAILFVDGSKEGFTPKNLDLKPGKHKLKLVLNQYHSLGRDFMVGRDQTGTLSFNLEPKPKNQLPGMAYIPAGEFIMGSNQRGVQPDEKPERRVFLKGYYIDITEVTNREYKKFLEATKRFPPDFMSDPDLNDPDQPVVGVSWEDAAAYTKWADKRLPTEAEWEKAARGDTGLKYPFGNHYKEKYANKLEKTDGYAYTAPVNKFPNGKSPYGLLNMAGNVREWCADWYQVDYHTSTPKKNPRGSKTGDYKVIKGGSWEDTAENLRTTKRSHNFPTSTDYKTGFRCAKSE